MDYQFTKYDFITKNLCDNISWGWSCIPCKWRRLPQNSLFLQIKRPRCPSVRYLKSNIILRENFIYFANR